ncbi:unnamed protein product [Arctia plantaginis]|uniref:Uncharacterized protein n=1 Tax=Arctia plantaginis TaxID=874455 RepID=A0A8S1AAR4_ARCPL|nr:unnamed protein product [Arctia plantaginis]
MIVECFPDAAEWQLLNALAMSNDTANSTPPQLTASSVTALRRNTASTVERPARKPNWASDRSGPTSPRCRTMRAERTLSNNLPASSSSTMGL